MTLLSSPPTRSTSDADVLFREAHQRRRRRRILMVTVAVVAIAAATSAVALTGSSGGHAQPPSATPPLPHPAVQLPGTAPRVAWVDYSDRVHVGSLQTGQQRVVASGPEAPQDATVSMVVSGRFLFWDTGSGVFYNTATRRAQTFSSNVMAYDTVTGRTRAFAPGAQVFNAVGSTDVFVVSDDGRHLARYSLDGRRGAQLTLPSGWFLPDPFGLSTTPALAHGALLLQSQAPVQAHSIGAKPTKLGVWTPATGSIRVLGDMWFTVATYTDARGVGSLLAWLPSGCDTSFVTCSVQLTNLTTGATRQIRNPLGFGFDMRGAFSPDGRQLAVFTKTNSGNYDPETRLALIDVATGTLRSVPDATIAIGEAVGWAQWLPGTKRLLVGGTCGSDGTGPSRANCFVADAATLHATAIPLRGNSDEDVNYSTVVLP